LQSRVQALLASPETIQALREENAVLKKPDCRFQTGGAGPGRGRPAEFRIDRDAETDRRVAVGSAVGFLEKVGPGKSRAAIADRGGEFRAGAPPPNQAENEARIRALTQERNSLLAKLGEANQELYGRRKQDAAARINVLTDE